MNCPDCGKQTAQLRSVTIVRDIDKNGQEIMKAEVIVYEQCINDDCSNKEVLNIVAVG